jgi:hypothetical protein
MTESPKWPTKVMTSRETTEFDDRYQVWERIQSSQDAITPGLFGKLTLDQYRYNRASGRLCRGIGAIAKPLVGLMKANNESDEPIICPTNVCGNAFCPSCWCVHQNRLGTLVDQIEAPYWHVRVTDPELVSSEPLHPAIMTRFRANHTAYQLVGYLPCLRYCETETVVHWDHRSEVRIETFYLYLVGLWTSDVPIGIKTDRIYERSTRRDLGGLETQSFPYRGAAWDYFVSLSDYPGSGVESSNYGEAIRSCMNFKRYCHLNDRRVAPK